MKKYLLSLGVIALAFLSLTSCLGSSTSEEKYTFVYGNSDCFNYVVDTETGDVYKGLNPAYNFVYNMSTSTVDIDISNLKLSKDLAGVTLRLPTQTFTTDDKTGFYNVASYNLTPLAASSAFVFDTFKFNSYPWRGQYPVYIMNYTVNNRYEVTVFPIISTYLGSIAATDLSPDATTPNYNLTNDPDGYYQVSINPEKETAVLYITGAKYSADMERFNFCVEDLPVTLTAAGYKIATAEGVKYPIKNTSNTVVPDCYVSDIIVNATLSYGATITFKCNLGEMGHYSVTATMRYLLYNNSNN